MLTAFEMNLLLHKLYHSVLKHHFFKMINFSSRTTPRIFASSFGNFLVILFSSIFIKGHFSFTSISSKRILLSANGTLSIAPGASTFFG